MTYWNSCFNPDQIYSRQPYTSQPLASPAYTQPQMTGQPQITGQELVPSALPTGIPSGPPYSGQTIPFTVPPLVPQAPQPPVTLQSPYYLAGKLRDYIGKDVRVEFLIGTGGALVDRIGTLLEVGANYIIIQPIRTDDRELCDLYSIKFVTVYG